LGDDGIAGLPEVLLGSAGLPDGFIELGLFAVLPGAVPVVVVLGPVPVIAPEPVVPDGVPTVEAPGAFVPLAPAVPLPACAKAIVLDRASTPASAKVVTFIGSFLRWLLLN
jgi:hypothetical protein